MLKIKLKGEELSVPEGTRVIDLVKVEEKCNYSVCRIGAQVKELNYRLTAKNDGSAIELLGLENIEGGKSY